MRKLFFIAGFVVSPILSTAQNSKWAVSFSPAFVLEPRFRPAIQCGLDYLINKKFSLLTETAFRIIQQADSAFSHSNYFRLKAELRYFKNEKQLGPYKALQFSYAVRNFDNLQGNFFYDGSSMNSKKIRYGQAHVSSSIVTFTFQSGWIYSLTKKLWIDLSLGCGVRDIHTKYSNILNPHPAPEARAPDVVISTDAYYFNGNKIRVQFDAAFRLLYRFSIH